MGHKVHPIGFRLGILYGWQSKWYADKNYTELLRWEMRRESWGNTPQAPRQEVHPCTPPSDSSEAVGHGGGVRNSRTALGRTLQLFRPRFFVINDAKHLPNQLPYFS